LISGFSYGVWGDGTFIYVAGQIGLTIFSVDGGGNFTHIDNHYIGYGGYNKVWGDGTYLYVAGGAGLLSYEVRTV